MDSIVHWAHPSFSHGCVEDERKGCGVLACSQAKDDKSHLVPHGSKVGRTRLPHFHVTEFLPGAIFVISHEHKCGQCELPETEIVEQWRGHKLVWRGKAKLHREADYIWGHRLEKQEPLAPEHFEVDDVVYVHGYHTVFHTSHDTEDWHDYVCSYHELEPGDTARKKHIGG